MPMAAFYFPDLQSPGFRCPTPETGALPVDSTTAWLRHQYSLVQQLPKTPARMTGKGNKKTTQKGLWDAGNAQVEWGTFPSGGGFQPACSIIQF